MSLLNKKLIHLFALVFFTSLIMGQKGTAAEAGGRECIDGDTNCTEWAQPEDPVLKQFRSHYKVLMNADTSQISAEQKQRAHDLWVSLQHKLVDHDAEIFRLRTQIKQSSGAAQEQAISDLVKLAGERKQILSEYFDALESIKNNGTASKITMPEAASTEKSKKYTITEHDIEIELSVGDPHMQEME